MKVRIGIDVGKDGAIVVFENDRLALKTVTPTIAKKEIDVTAITKILIPYVDCDTHIVVEDVHAIHGSSANGTFQFGRALGILEGITTALGIPFTKVAPKAWQKEMWQGVPILYKPKKADAKTDRKYADTKATSLVAVSRLFPREDLRASERCKNPHDGIVDALLMAEYCKRKF